MGKFCYHWDTDKTGTCDQCGATVTVSEGWGVTVTFGATEAPDEYGRDRRAAGEWSLSRPTPPTVTEAIALALGCHPSDVALIDATSTGTYDRKVIATYTLRGAKVVLTAETTARQTVIKSPARVEMPEEVAAS